MDKFFLVVCVKLTLIGLTWGYGTYVPITTVSNLCGSMTPRHAELYESNNPSTNTAPYLNAQTSPTLYEIVVNGTCFKPGDVLQVTLRGKFVQSNNAPFLGVFVMARKKSSPAASENYGTFTIPSEDTSLKTYDCFSKSRSAVGHNNRNTKRSKEVFWTAPSGFKSDMVFVGTFVKERTVFWTDVRSAVIEYDSECGSANTLKISYATFIFIAFSYLYL